MGISFLTQLSPRSSINVRATMARYRSREVPVAGRTETWWLREPLSVTAEFDGPTVSRSHGRVAPAHVGEEKHDGLELSIEARSRPRPDGASLVTVCLVNRTPGQNRDQQSVFQTEFQVTLEGGAAALPYPEPPQVGGDPDEASLALLYRHSSTYAIGHGCAADWDKDDSVESPVRILRATPLPVYEAPSISPDIEIAGGGKLEVSMAALAGLVDGDDGLAQVEEVLDGYEHWIADLTGTVSGLTEQHQATASNHITTCYEALRRMRRGLAAIRRDDKIKLAFQLANHAMLLQQLRSAREVRKSVLDPDTRRYVYDRPYPRPDPVHPPEGAGMWRPFQIAFLLAALCSTADPTDKERDVVELIWFPTGGGKTEAYLALSAFALFYRRITGEREPATHVVMRYTLRLLTAQQFQRASILICAMEYLRGRHSLELGETPFTIGIWLGGDTTPNTREDALANLRELGKGGASADYRFLLGKCPWCSAGIGPRYAEYSYKNKRPVAGIPGLERFGATVVLRCPDPECDFHALLPVVVIDEDIYDLPPSVVIGTIDKFAMLAWRSDARSLFGIAADGARRSSPPGIIIQDELHLIAGPLGSMAGLYETVIEDLCTSDSDGLRYRPKLVASTATIRRYEDQVARLYARNKVALFPPRGFDAGKSFFSTYARDADGKLRPGRSYVGVFAPGLNSMQTVQVRTFAALLQSPMAMTPADSDPWWTLIAFFNSLRELGTSLTLFQSDIPDYLLAIKRRLNIGYDALRRIRRSPLELTSRLLHDEVPQAIEQLEIPRTAGGPMPVDACLASSIVEAGIDIDRLSLIAVVGQPKTTAQYIQVTGRVGRRWWERPGIVVSLYGVSKARDRSHFEQFRSYHERLYAQVEPTSVTPFAPPVLERALHAVVVAYVRQRGSQATVSSPYPYPKDLIHTVEELLRARVAEVDPEEASAIEDVLARKMGEWQRWDPQIWMRSPIAPDAIPLLRQPGQYVDPIGERRSWPTPQSLRNVDAECEAVVTSLYGDEV